ncbi:MAG: RIP metalloprotease RseP [Deltaproteobacteria bacterium]|nr:RIP metalloprotease RseP [Deltaproteobacteria bacterium]
MSYLPAILGLALLIVVHEWGHFIVARLCGMRVERFSIGFGKPLFSVKRGDTIYQIAPIPLGGFVQITGLNPHEEFDHTDPYVFPNRPRWMRLAVLVSGALANYLTAVVLAVIMFGAYGVPSLKVEKVMPNTPAQAAGLKDGDELIEANGQALSVRTPINQVIAASGGKPVSIKIQRAGKEQIISVVPESKDGAFRIGVQIGGGSLHQPLPMSEALLLAATVPVDLSGRILDGFWQMITGKQKAELSGPVGIAQRMKQAADHGALEFLDIMIMLSVYLGLFNLLPVPALDGGRVVFLLFSSLGRREVNAKTEATVHMVGLMLMMGVFVLVTFKDIVKLFKN